MPGRSIWTGTLVAFLALSAVAGVHQAWTSDSAFAHRSDALAPPIGAAPISWYDPGLYNDASTPVVEVPRNRFVMLDTAKERAGSFAETIDLPAGYAPIATNIAAGPYLIDVAGVEVIGRTSGDNRDWCYLCGRPTMVVRRLPGNGTGPVNVRVEARVGPVVRTGRILSAVSLAVLTAWILLEVARERRRKRSTT